MNKILVALTEHELTLIIWSLEDSGRAYSDKADELQSNLRALRERIREVSNSNKP